jgi:hypothetical protein
VIGTKRDSEIPLANPVCKSFILCGADPKSDDLKVSDPDGLARRDQEIGWDFLAFFHIQV